MGFKIKKIETDSLPENWVILKWYHYPILLFCQLRYWMDKEELILYRKFRNTGILVGKANIIKH